MIRVAVCDDEEIYRNIVTNSTRQLFEEHKVCKYEIKPFSSGKELLRENQKEPFDVVFLDINMPEITGMEIAAQLREKGQETILVFITAFIDYSLEGYKMEAIRFLLKDTLQDTLPECIEAIIKKKKWQMCRLTFDFLEGTKEVPTDEIYYIESKLHKLLFHMTTSNEGCLSMYGKLDKIEELLKDYGFIRIHKSFLVNVNYIRKIANYQVYMADNSMLAIPREKYQKVKERYYELIGEML